MDSAALIAWFLDPARSPEELYLAELLLEVAEDHLPRIHEQDVDVRDKAKEEKRRLRALDPGYRPDISRKRLEEAEPYFASVTRFWPLQSYDDRRAGDISVLRFFPRLETFHAYTRLRDLAPLASVSSLKDLSLTDDVLRDLSALGSLPKLERLSLTLRHPWPRPEGLETLEACVRLSLHLNLQIVEGIPAWPRADSVDLSTIGAPLRDLTRLPAMPVVKQLKVDAAELHGIDRYPSLEKLELRGVFEDLSPLAKLPRLQELTLHGERFDDLAPLARLPSLRRLTLWREHGLVLDPLLEAPRLRNVKAPRCRVIATELASLNAAISWPREDFRLDTPRRLSPLRAICYEWGHPEERAVRGLPQAPDGRELIAAGDDTFAEAEGAWMLALMEKTLNQHLGPDWGRLREQEADQLYIVFFRAIERRAAWSVLELVRSVFAVARFPWSAMIAFDEAEEDEYWSRTDDDEDDGVYVESPEEIEEQRQRVRERRAFLEREHQLRLGAQGLTIKPADVGAESAAKPPVPDPAPDEQAEPEETAYVPFDHLRLTLTEDIAWITEVWEDNARAILDRELENWHALPEPPEKRPRPA